MSKSKILIDNKKVKITSWSFNPGEETGAHLHKYDYVVVPMNDGQLKLINQDGTVSVSKLKKGESYFREKGVNHNVINDNEFFFSFVEIEIK